MRTGYGLDDQRQSIQQEADRRGWSVMWEQDDGISGKTLERPALVRGLEALQRRSASALVVAKLDRLSRSVVDFAQLVERSHREGWQLVILDLGVDTTTPAGKLIANVFAALAEWERETIAARTRAAMAAAKARGVRFGRPSGVPPEIREAIVGWRDQGWTYQRIADELTARGVPTPQRATRWRKQTIGLVLRDEKPA